MDAPATKRRRIAGPDAFAVIDTLQIIDREKQQLKELLSGGPLRWAAIAALSESEIAELFQDANKISKVIAKLMATYTVALFKAWLPQHQKYCEEMAQRPYTDLNLSCSEFGKLPLAMVNAQLKIEDVRWPHPFIQQLLATTPSPELLQRAKKTANEFVLRTTNFEWAPMITKQQSFFSPFFARILDRFLFPEQEKGAVLGNLQWSTTKEIADIAILSFQESDNEFEYPPFIGITLGVGESKPDSISEATAQLAAYISRAAAQHFKERQYPILLGLALTVHTISFSVYFAGKATNEIAYYRYHVAECAWQLATNVLCQVAQAVTSLPAYISQHGLSHPAVAPILYPDWNGANVELLRGRANVLKYNGFVWKVYDRSTIDLGKNAFQTIMKLTDEMRIAYLPECSLVADIKPWLAIRYRFMATGPSSEKHYKEIHRQLTVLHSLGIVHSDVRPENIIFGTSPEESRLIDFDLAGPIGTEYPDIFNQSLDCRHPAAKPKSKRLPEHDLHALKFMATKEGFELLL